jgi:hypothetical protein
MCQRMAVQLVASMREAHAPSFGVLISNPLSQEVFRKHLVRASLPVRCRVRLRRSFCVLMTLLPAQELIGEDDFLHCYLSVKLWKERPLSPAERAGEGMHLARKYFGDGPRQPMPFVPPPVVADLLRRTEQERPLPDTVFDGAIAALEGHLTLRYEAFVATDAFTAFIADVRSMDQLAADRSTQAFSARMTDDDSRDGRERGTSASRQEPFDIVPPLSGPISRLPTIDQLEMAPVAPTASGSRQTTSGVVSDEHMRPASSTDTEPAEVKASLPGATAAGSSGSASGPAAPAVIGIIGAESRVPTVFDPPVRRPQAPPRRSVGDEKEMSVSTHQHGHRVRFPRGLGSVGPRLRPPLAQILQLEEIVRDKDLLAGLVRCRLVLALPPVLPCVCSCVCAFDTHVCAATDGAAATDDVRAARALGGEPAVLA